MDLIVKNGTVVTATDTYQADVAVSNGVVAQIGTELATDGAQVIDATGCYVMPGAIDVHTHLSSPSFGMITVDDFNTGTIAAACGGTTSIVDFCMQAHGQSLADALVEWHAMADGIANIDYGFHSVVTDKNMPTFHQFQSAFGFSASGFTSDQNAQSINHG